MPSTNKAYCDDKRNMEQKRITKRWTTDDIEFVREHLGNTSLEDMALALNRSVMSVRLFILRQRWSVGPHVQRNLVQRMLQLRFRNIEDFQPSRKFYQETGMGQRRWWNVFHGRSQITTEEYLSLAKYFGVTLQEAFESRQLDLFDDK